MKKKQNKYSKLILLFKILVIIGGILSIVFCFFAFKAELANTQEYNIFDKIALIILIFLVVDCCCLYILMNFFKKEKIYF